VVLVDLEGEAPARVEVLLVPRHAELLQIPAEPAGLEQVLAEIEALAAPEVTPDLPFDRQPYLEVRVRPEGPAPDLRARVEAALRGKPVRLARIHVEAGPGATEGSPGAPLSLDQLEKIEPRTVLERAWKRTYPGEVPAEILSDLAEMEEQARAAEGSQP
jgi:exonuclease SbcD